MRGGGAPVISGVEGGTGRRRTCTHEAQLWLAAATKWEGKGEWAGQGERRGRPWLGQIRSWARVQKEILFEFQLILEFGRTLEN
jgi:hypothetical protein